MRKEIQGLSKLAKIKRGDSLYLEESSSDEGQGKSADEEVSDGDVQDEHTVGKPPASPREDHQDNQEVTDQTQDREEQGRCLGREVRVRVHVVP